MLAIYWSRELECGQLRLGIKWLEMAKRLEIPPGSAVLKMMSIFHEFLGEAMVLGLVMRSSRLRVE